MRPDSDNYRQILLSEAPLLDVRAPCEFNEGAFPGAVNMPLMDDEERRQVGICYKQQGQQAAIALGHKLVSGDIKAQRVAAWRAFAERHRDTGYLYCFRGGLRSRTSRDWLAEAGINFPIVKGGYKALRRFCIDELERICQSLPLLLLGGLTGCDKTGFLRHFAQGIDLEGYANHRGSSFGRWPEPQPTQINFENELAIAMMRLEQQGAAFLLLEDEARLIGSCSIPLPLRNVMLHAPLVILEVPFAERVEQIYREYVLNTFAAYEKKYAENAFTHYAEYLLAALDAIRKRLGSERHQELRSLMSESLMKQQQSGETEQHLGWIELLLGEYYDPMYRYQIGNKAERIIFQGDRKQVKDFIDNMNQDELRRICRKLATAGVEPL